MRIVVGRIPQPEQGELLVVDLRRGVRDQSYLSALELQPAQFRNRLRAGFYQNYACSRAVVVVQSTRRSPQLRYRSTLPDRSCYLLQYFAGDPTGSENYGRICGHV